MVKLLSEKSPTVESFWFAILILAWFVMIPGITKFSVVSVDKLGV